MNCIFCILLSRKRNCGIDQVDSDPPRGRKLRCFGKVGLRRYREKIKGVFGKRQWVHRP